MSGAKKKITAWGLLSGLALTFFAAVVVGIRRFGLPESRSTVRLLEREWNYATDTGQSGTVRLPAVFSLPQGTTEVRLTTTLPEWSGESHALYFVSMEQMVEVIVDGESRYRYGMFPDAEDFVYRSARHVNQVPLEETDMGKMFTIVYRAPQLFIIELGLWREVRLGSVGDLVLYQFGESIPYLFISLSTILITLSALAMLTTYRGVSRRGNIYVLFLAIVTVAFFNSENTAFWAVLHHSPRLSALMDWSFYYLDPLVHLLAWLSVYAAGWKTCGQCRRALWAFGGLYVALAAVSLAGCFNFNLARPFFMVAGFVYSAVLWTDGRKNLQDGPMGLAAAVWVLMAGYYADYVKYCLMLLPVSARWSVFLQLEVSFQYFTGIALLIFAVMVLRITLGQLAKREADMQVEAATALLLAKYARQQYESIVQRETSMRSLNHDMKFHFRTAAAMISDGEAEEARQYLTALGETVEKVRHAPWCEDYAANLAIGWYADQFAQRHIPFSAEARIPALSKEVYADISCIFSNALQNALEACEGQEEPFVRLTAGTKGNALVICIENRCSEALKAMPQGFPTTKKDPGHGLGIASMKAAAHRQGGFLDVSVKEGVFRVDVVLCDVFV